MTHHIDPVRAVEALAKRALAARNELARPGVGPAPSACTAVESSADFIHRVNRSTRAAVQRAASPLPQDVQLPQWPDTVRGVPNVVLRSALFCAARSRAGERPYLREELIASVSGVEIRYTGERLDQGDLDAWQVLLHLAREHTLGAEFDTTTYNLLRRLGKTDSGGRRGNRAALENRILRLRAALLGVRSDSITYYGNLIERATRREGEAGNRWKVKMDPHLEALFGNNHYTHIDWQIRQQMDGHALAQWLHGFYSSHAAPHPIATATLHKLCGSEAKHLFHFREKLREALGVVANASTANGQPFRAHMDGDLVLVERAPSKAQRKHLRKANAESQVSVC